jgi:hypothetical protein
MLRVSMRGLRFIRVSPELKQRNTRCHRALCTELSKAREAAGISKRALSARLRRSPNFAHFVETGNRLLSICEFIEYAEAIGADPLVLLKRVIG